MRWHLIVLSVVLSGCTAAGAGVAPGSSATDANPVSLAPTTAPAPVTSIITSTSTSSSTTTTIATTTTTELSTASLGPAQALSARSDAPLEVFDAPGDVLPSMVLEATTMLGTPRVVQVLEGPADGWMRVALPVRPNGSQGWIRQSDVTLFVLDRRVEVDLGDRTLRVIGPDGLLLETTVAIGSPANPTPVGEFFVTDSVILTEPGGPWGPWAFGLSAYSDTISEFNGGNGIIGIHGTNQPASIGRAQSLGCVRVPNDVALQLGELISAGVPVRISG
jgi:lipoprotein-anchoring transpeptidase ErfK/SrfK